MGNSKTKNGDVYEGDIVNGKLHGQGKLTQSSGHVREGRWINDKFTG